MRQTITTPLHSLAGAPWENIKGGAHFLKKTYLST